MTEERKIYEWRRYAQSFAVSDPGFFRFLRAGKGEGMSGFKPLGRKNYGSIGHLPESRMGPGDHHVPEGQAIICCSQRRDKHDEIIVTEKVDGSNCGVARISGEIIALGRAGYLARTSKFEQHRMFSEWVEANEQRFSETLEDGERLVGEWMAQAHGTRYLLPHEPFVVFDLMRDDKRAPWSELVDRASLRGFILPRELNRGNSFPVERALSLLEASGHGALDMVEGAVWRVERRGVFDFMAKYVRPDKIDGSYLSEYSGQPDVWNWRPMIKKASNDTPKIL